MYDVQVLFKDADGDAGKWLTLTSQDRHYDGPFSTLPAALTECARRAKLFGNNYRVVDTQEPTIVHYPVTTQFGKIDGHATMQNVSTEAPRPGSWSAAPQPLTAQPHYTELTPEPIDVIEAWGLNFRKANALKYIARAGRKDASVVGTVRDLEKAISYLRREINALQGKPGW